MVLFLKKLINQPLKAMCIFVYTYKTWSKLKLIELINLSINIYRLFRGLQNSEFFLIRFLQDPTHKYFRLYTKCPS